ncbi:hypothetical protein TNCV_2102711 [Trichonephila clavipes]|nr:hypothetical protein TNCV_2102711 [Trichonephila clavipes]
MSSFLVLCEGDTKNRWHDGQECPDVRQETMAPWARRLGCVLACYVQIGRGRGEEKKGRKRRRKVGRERTEGRGDGTERRREEKPGESEKEKG